MTKNDITAIITTTAARRGFTAEENSFLRWPNITEPTSHYLNFCITEEYPENTDWSKRSVEVRIRIRASLATMGGNPIPEDLIQASEIIREGAELVKELEAMNLSYTETY